MKKLKIDKKRLYLVALTAGGILLIILWINMYFKGQENKKISEINSLKGRYEQVFNLSKNLNTKTKTVNESLMVFLENLMENLKLSDRIVSIRPLNVQGGSESALMRVENLNLLEIISFFQSIDEYGNISFNQISQVRRFDNEELADLNLEIVKLK
jgi:hypothetical protein